MKERKKQTYSSKSELGPAQQEFVLPSSSFE